MIGLGPSADGTGFHILAGVGSDGWPPENGIEAGIGSGKFLDGR